MTPQPPAKKDSHQVSQLSLSSVPIMMPAASPLPTTVETSDADSSPLPSSPSPDEQVPSSVTGAVSEDLEEKEGNLQKGILINDSCSLQIVYIPLVVLRAGKGLVRCYIPNCHQICVI